MKKIFFTKTLAELYEKQDMLWEAFIVYKKLYAQNPKDEFKRKIDSLGDKLIDESLYSQITLKIFDKSELSRFLILPEQHYKIYMKILKDLTDTQDFNRILDSYSEIKNPDEDIKNYSGEEIYEILQTNFGDKKPNEIKLADIYEIIKNK